MRSSNPVQVFRLVYGVILFQTLVYQMKWGSFASWVSTKPVSSSRNNLLDIPHLPQTFTIAYKIWRELKNNIDDYRLKVGPDWARELKFGGWAGGWAERIQVSAGQLSDLYKIMILLRKSVVAGAGFEPATFGLWARWATWLLHPAMWCQECGVSTLSPPEGESWSERRVSNPRLSAWKADALPTELLSRNQNHY